MRDLFRSTNHHPSTEQWAAIDDLLHHLERAANDDLQPAVYVSAIPAGTGKTTAIAEFAKALMAATEKSHVGMLITCSRVEEVRDMASRLGSWRHRLCVIVGRDHPDVLAFGDHEMAGDAQVLVCTQEALKRSLKLVPSFEAAARFHYRGRRRAVVAWDEAFQFNRPVVLNPWKALALADAMRRRSPEAAEALLGFVQGAKAGNGLCVVPDFEDLGLDFPALEHDVADNDDTLLQAQALAVITGKAGFLINDNRGGVLVSHIPELPANLLPVIVTDASAAAGVHHVSYEQMGRTRRVVRLKEAAKTYKNMAIRIVPMAASRSTYRSDNGTDFNARTLIEMAVAYVRRVAPAEVLVVSYKNRFKMSGVKEHTIAQAIDARLTDDERARVKHLTWGRHTATNDHQHVQHVVLMGLNFLPRAAGYAASGAAQDKAMCSADVADHPTDEQVEDMRRGMLRDSTLQALLRGNARQGRDGDCGPMVAVIPQVRQSGLSDAEFRAMFPGVAITVDRSLLPPPKLKGNLRKLQGAVETAMARGDRTIPYPDLRRDLDMEAGNFGKLVKQPDWLAWIASAGLTAGVLSGRTTGLVREAPVEEAQRAA